MKNPNVLFITLDQWRSDCLEGENPIIKTPNINKLRQRAVYFAAHYNQTVPCGPSRASIHTGMYLHNHRAVLNGTPLSNNFSNMALEVRKAGYQPALFGYTDYSADPYGISPNDPILKTYEGILPGYDVIVQTTDYPYSWLNWLESRGYTIPDEPSDIWAPRLLGANGDRSTLAEVGSNNAPIFSKEDTQTAFLTEECMRYISRFKHQPWFVHLSHLSPHPPFIVPEPYNKMYAPDEVPPAIGHPSAQQEAQQHPFIDYLLKMYNPRLKSQEHGRRASNINAENPLQTKAIYYGMISEVDYQLGRLFNHLEAEGLWDDTIIILTTDHGEQMNDHHLMSKVGFFEQSYHIPLIIRVPDQADAHGQRIAEFTENVDIMPTVLELLGLPIIDQIDGKSLAPFIEGNQPEGWRDAAHWEADFRIFNKDGLKFLPELSHNQRFFSVLRDKNFKYVHFASEKLSPILYDLSNDPHELHNVYADRRYRETVLEYTTKMLNWLMQSNTAGLSCNLVSDAGLLYKSRWSNLL